MARLKKEYHLFGNLIYNLKSSKKWDRKLFYSQFAYVVPAILGTYFGVLLPARLVDGLTNQFSVKKLLFILMIYAVGMGVCNILASILHEYMYRNGTSLAMYYSHKCFGKIMKIPYENLERHEAQEVYENTWNVIRNKYGMLDSVLLVPQFMASLIGAIWFGIVLGRKSILMLLLSCLSLIISSFVLKSVRKWHSQFYSQINQYTRKTAYINREVMESASGKDIRLYHMADMFLQKYDASLHKMEMIYKRIHNVYFECSLIDIFFLFFINCFAYIYLIYLVLQNQITVAQLVLYIGMFAQFSVYIKALIDIMNELTETNTAISYIRKFMALEEEKEENKKKMHVNKQQGMKIEFRNVGYQYPGALKPTLQDINITIHENEKAALIGLNGAGKTTLVKLMCGFYTPTSGEILVDDIPYKEYSAHERMRLFAALFQDSDILPLSLDANLTGETAKEAQENRVNEALFLSGFAAKYQKLPQKGKTLLVKEVHKEAVDFSGGEKQKFLFARALYKDSKMMILDEPTAALDPIAENEIYQKYGEISKNKTSLFISHRLSSTKFCDQIYLLQDGKIIETGTHDELMEKRRSYYQLYMMQSRYYKENQQAEA